MFRPLIYILTIGALLSCNATAKTKGVTVSGRRIMVDGKRYIIRGICYNPVPKGSSKRSFATLTEDLALMVEAGVNTIRVYSPIDDRAVLDEIHAAGIKVIMGFSYELKDSFDIRSGSCVDYVNKYKDHPAVLMWELGNEYNYHPEWFKGGITTWYEALNNTAELIHQADPSHPVSTAHGEVPDAFALSSCPNVDVWGLNTYRWDHLLNKEGVDIFEQWSDVSSKPMYLSESGADSYMTIDAEGYDQGENQEAQADATGKILKAVFRNTGVCSGITLFSFTDGWWKAGNPRSQDPGGEAPNSGGVPYDGAPNEEYWGIVDIDRNKKAVFPIVKEAYKKNAR